MPETPQNRVTLAPSHDPARTYLYVNNCRMSVAALIAMDAVKATFVDARGCTGLTVAIFAGQDSCGYDFIGLKLHDGWHIFAGWRNFSFAKARMHWAGNAECLALAERIIEEAGRRDALAEAA